MKAVEASLPAALLSRFAGFSTIVETSSIEAIAMVRRNDQPLKAATQFAYWLPTKR
jgi:hypothetical protein